MNRTLETYGSNSLKSHIASGSHPKFYFKNYFSKKVPIFRHTPLGASHKKKHPRPSQVTLWLESQRKPLREATWLLMSKASLKSLVDGWNAGLYNSISDLVWWRLVQFKEHGYSNSGHNGIHSDSDPKKTDIESNRNPRDRLATGLQLLGNDLWFKTNKAGHLTRGCCERLVFHVLILQNNWSMLVCVTFVCEFPVHRCGRTWGPINRVSPNPVAFHEFPIKERSMFIAAPRPSKYPIKCVKVLYIIVMG